MILLGVAVLVLVVLAVLIYLGRRGKHGAEAFQNPSPPSTPTFTMFFAEWCGHCKKAKPAFVEFMADGKIELGGKPVVIEMVDADGDSPKLKTMPIKGFPTFILQLPDGSIKEYQGKREVAGYLEFLNKELGGGIQTA